VSFCEHGDESSGIMPKWNSLPSRETGLQKGPVPWSQEALNAHETIREL
jgi:hypothetical protein